MSLKDVMSGGRFIIKAPKYGKIEIGIPSMYYKDKLVDALTRLKALRTRNKQKSIILEETNDSDIVIENNGEKQPDKDGIKFHTLKIKVPKKLINIKQLKRGDKEVEVPTLTEKSKNLTTRNKIRSIKFKTIEGNSVKIITNTDNVLIRRLEDPVEEPIVPVVELIKDPKNEFEEEVNKLIKFSLGHINFDEFSQELINPDITGTSPKSGIYLSGDQLFTYYLTLKYKMTLVYSGTILNGRESSTIKHNQQVETFSYDNDLWLNMFNEMGLYRGAWDTQIRYYLNPDTLKPEIRPGGAQPNVDFNLRRGTIGDYKQIFKNQIKDILEKSNKQFILPISIGLKSSGGGHKLFALFRPFEKKIYVIDPHGEQGVPDYKTTYKDQNTYFSNLAYDLGYTYVKSEDSCPYIRADKKRGFQSMEVFFQREQKVKKVLGFCGYWSYFLMELALQHPNLPMNEVYKKAADIFTADPGKVYRTIVKYQANMSMIINEIAKDNGLNLNNAMDVFEGNFIDGRTGADRIDISKVSDFQKFMKTISNNLTRICLLQKEKLGYGKSNDISNYFFHEDLTGSGNGDYFYHEDLTGGDFFDDEDWNKILEPQQTLEGSGNKKFNMLEIFKGTGSVGKVFKKQFNVVSIDFDPIFTPDIETDILDWDYKKWYNETKFKPDFIWASPPCNTFSPLAYPLKERNTQTAEPYSERAKIGTAIAHKTVEIIKFFEKVNPKLIYIIENPRGMLRHDKIYKNLPFLNTTLYCLYKDCRYKPTDFWSNVDLELKEPIKKNCYTRIGEKPCGIVDIPLSDRYKIPAVLLQDMKKKVMNHMGLKGGDIDWWGIAKDIGSDLYKQGTDYISKLGETEEQKEARIKKEEACKLCKEGSGLSANSDFYRTDPKRLKGGNIDFWLGVAKDVGSELYKADWKKGGVCPKTGKIPCMCGGELYAKDKYKTKENELTESEKKLINQKYGSKNPQINEIKAEPMGDDDIKKYFPNAKILKYSELQNYQNITQLLPQNKTFFFLLYEHAPNEGHWVAVLRYRDDDSGKDTIEYFCSYGTKIDGPLTWSGLDRRIQLGQDKPYLSMLLDKSPFNIVYNKVQYQSKKSGIATCGAYDTLRVGEMVRHNTNLSEFTSMLEEVKKATGLSYDDIVANLVDIR